MRMSPFKPFIFLATRIEAEARIKRIESEPMPNLPSSSFRALRRSCGLPFDCKALGLNPGLNPRLNT